MADPKIVQLVKRLHEKTIAGQIPWEQTVDEGVFQAAFKDYAVRIFVRPTQHPEMDPASEDIVIQIFNKDGVLVEQVDDTDFTKEDFGKHSYGFMEEIHSAARRVVMGVDKAIQALLDALE